MAVNKNFIVKNGIEVNNNLIYSDTELNSVGIGTTIVQHKFHVIGGIGATNTVISGISTVGSLSIGSNEVISSARQLKNIASLDTTTQNTIEAATKGSPNEYDDLVITGVSTFKADVIAEDNLLVSGIATFTGTPNLPGANVSGVSTFTGAIDANGGADISGGSGLNVTGHSELDNVNVSGVSTFAGIGTFSSHLYVAGNLNVVGDVVYDEVTGRNINITGLGTIAQLNSTNAVLGVATATSFVGDLTGTLQTAAQPNITSLGTIANLSATNANITGVGTVAQFNATNASIGVVTFTTATISNLVGDPLSGVSTEFTGQIGIQSGGLRIGTGVTQLNFVGSGNTFQYNPSTDTVDITISGGGGGGGGGSVSIGQTAPVTPSSGDLWFNIDIARTFVYYDESALGVGSSAFWVDASPFEASGMFLSKMGDNMLAGLGITAGTISAPGLYFNGDTNTGLYSPAADQFAFTAGGVGIATFQAGILEAGGARFSAGGVSAGIVTATALNVAGSGVTITGTDTNNYVNIKNTTASDSSGARKSLIVFQGTQSGSEVTDLVHLAAMHDGGADDQNGAFRVYVNDGNDGSSPTERFGIGKGGEFRVNQSIGSAGQVIQSAGSGSPAVWATPAVGWTKLGSGSATSGTTSVVTTNQLTSSYMFYKILFRVRLGTAGAFGINISTNGGTSYTTADSSWTTAVSGRSGSSTMGITEACNWGQLLAGNNKLYYAGEMTFNYPDGTTMKPNFHSDFSYADSVAGSNDAYGTATSTTIFDTVGAYNAIRLESTQTIADLKWTFLGMAV